MVQAMTGRTEAVDIKARWGDQLRTAREATLLSQPAVSRLTGLQASTISRAERGRGSLDVYHRLAAHYGLTLEAGDGQA
jgi:transcriptional regulator with XRE-family HTH domain